MKNDKLTEAMIDLLTRARKLISNTRAQFVCIALNGAFIDVSSEIGWGDSRNHERAHRILVNWILGSLGGEETVEGWLHSKQGISKRKFSARAMKAYRMAWINHMIEALKKGLK